MNSEVFDNYVVIAREQGLISEASDSARVGSDDLSTIELLYGVKPNGKAEKSIVEQAHPDSVVIAPSYDLLNGLVENVQERQNIIISIINKAPQSKLTQHRYAETQELMDELIRVGFLMDNKDQLDLMKLADSCTEKLQKKAVLPLLAGIAAGLSLIGIYSNFAYLSQGVGNDCDNAIDAIVKLSNEVPDISAQLTELNDGIRYVKKLYEQAMKLSSNFKSIKHDNAVQGAVNINNSSIGQSGFKLLEQYKKAAIVLADRIMKVYVPVIQTADVPEERSSTLWKGIMTGVHALFGSAKSEALSKLVGANIDLVGQGGLVDSLRKSIEQISAKEKAMQAYVEQNKGSLVEYLTDASKSEESSILDQAQPKKNLMDELKNSEKPKPKGMVV